MWIAERTPPCAVTLASSIKKKQNQIKFECNAQMACLGVIAACMLCKENTGGGGGKYGGAQSRTLSRTNCFQICTCVKAL